MVDKEELQLHGRREEDLQKEGGRWRRRRQQAEPAGKKEKRKKGACWARPGLLEGERKKGK